MSISSVLHIISGPLLGAGIGWLTNALAISMLFHPYKPIQVFGHTLPFTPGVIPRRQGAMAKAVGRAVSTHLFTGDDIRKAFLSEETEKRVTDYLMNRLHSEPGRVVSIRSFLEFAYAEDELDAFYDRICDRLTSRLLEAFLNMQPGEFIAAAGSEVVRDKLGRFSFLISDSMIHSVMDSMAQRIDSYITEHGASTIRHFVEEEINSVTSRPVDTFITDEERIRKLCSVLYKSCVEKLLSELLSSDLITNVVEQKIMAMHPAELEQLTLSVMKKELGAVVNLGALLGCLIGVLMLFF